MYSVKPGRGPSCMGCMGGLIGAGFGVVWTIGAIMMGAALPAVLFGLLFIGVALLGAAYNFFNATSRNRMSTCDITIDNEESDPVATILGHNTQAIPPKTGQSEHPPRKYPGDHCPYCGAQANASFDFCPQCGKDI